MGIVVVNPHEPVVRSSPLLIFIFILFLNVTWYNLTLVLPYKPRRGTMYRATGDLLGKQDNLGDILQR